MTGGLKDRYRAALVDILISNPRVERIVLFGSRARGDFRATSDVDLVLYGPDLTLSDQAGLAMAIEETSVPQRVDLLLHHHVGDQQLLDHIDRHGVEWYDRMAMASSG